MEQDDDTQMQVVLHEVKIPYSLYYTPGDYSFRAVLRELAFWEGGSGVFLGLVFAKKLEFNIVARDLPGGKRILIIKMRAQHITFGKAIKAITVRF